MTGWLAANMAWASLLMLAVLLIRRPFARAFGAGPAYALWLLPVARFIMPPLPAWPAEVPSLLSSQTVILWAEEAAAPMSPDGGPGHLPILLAIWALGAAALLVWQWLAYRHFLARLSAGARGIGAYRGVPLVESDAVKGPLALGLLDRRIVVPADFATRYTPAERMLALDHEAIHHRRGDIWWNHLALVLLALNWFNPITWIAFRAFRADQELACDAAVIASADAEARRDYAQALVKSASRPGLIAACPLNHADQLKRRLRMMNDHRRSRARLIGGAAALALLSGIGLSAGAPSLAQQAEQAKGEPRTERREERIIIRAREGGEREARAERREGSGDGNVRVEERRQVIVMSGREGADREVRRFRFERPDGTEIDIPSGCDGVEPMDVETGENSRTRIMLCSRDGGTPAERAERLQRARDRLAGEDHLRAETRERVLAAIDREIARLRAQ
jgi:beta-lactamase regulating signal transducer with metallopeptidase domain